MSPTFKKYVITSFLAAVVATIGLIVFTGPPKKPAPAPAEGDAAVATEQSTAAASAPTEPAPAAAPDQPQASAAPAPAPTLAARVPAGLAAVAEPAPIGSLDPATAPYLVRFTPHAAGIAEIVFADYWQNVQDATRAAKARKAGDAAAMPADDRRHVLARATELDGVSVPVLGALEIWVDGARVGLFGRVWAETAPGAFATEVADASGAPVLRVDRAFRRGQGDFDLVLEQRVTNLGAAPRKVRLVGYGPADLIADSQSYLDVRRYHFGYLFPESRDPSQTFVTANGQLLDRSKVASQVAANDFVLWPNRASREGDFRLSWFGTTDRYFSLAVHAPYAPPGSPSRRLLAVEEIRGLSNGLGGTSLALFSELWSPTVEIAPGAAAALDLGVFAGPLAPTVLDREEPFASLNMGDLVVYLMSGCCSWCTFAWLADGMLWFLRFLHDYVVFDWGVAIIALVVVVRLILHPLQKKSQIAMQRFSRAMTAMKPELDALQKKFKDDPARMQQEQMRLFREKGVSPAGCVGGMLPTFAQMPIWFALYAVLFFAIELRHEPAFFGVFQAFGDWGFLSDLAAQDNFIRLPFTANLLLFQLSSINLLPILMGIVFWIQQQYMTPAMPNVSPEQAAQQKMMKWMMVIMFPLMTYVAPSGLTLYIMTSTCIGILEGRMIKKQVDAMDLSAPAKTKRKQDFLGRLYEQALERAKERSEAAQKKKFKNR
jgi:YidC/Oxa1 family membrane protein insertase